MQKLFLKNFGCYLFYKNRQCNYTNNKNQREAVNEKICSHHPIGNRH